MAYLTDQKPMMGSPAHTMTYRGSTFQFVSAANREAFAAAPDRYVPHYGGFCAYGFAGGSSRSRR
ncbi:MAG: hypothetical protein HZB35_02675 [Nitrospirae bacterium]|nr:hypothetical protein [Nitrospirota bacterium]